jgi:hypothetical protein
MNFNNNSVNRTHKMTIKYLLMSTTPKLSAAEKPKLKHKSIKSYESESPETKSRRSLIMIKKNGELQ